MRNESLNEKFLRKAFGRSITMTFLIILLNEFHICGFHLTETFLNWRRAATVGQVAVLFKLVLSRRRKT